MKFSHWLSHWVWKDKLNKIVSAFEKSTLYCRTGFPGGSVVKNPLPMQETQIGSLGWEDLLEKKMATHSIILPWQVSWTKKPGGLQSLGSQRVRDDWATKQQQQQGSRGKISRNETRKLRDDEIIKFLPNLHSLRKPSNGFGVYSIDNDEPMRLFLTEELKSSVKS